MEVGEKKSGREREERSWSWSWMESIAKQEEGCGCEVCGDSVVDMMDKDEEVPMNQYDRGEQREMPIRLLDEKLDIVIEFLKLEREFEQEDVEYEEEMTVSYEDESLNT